LRVCLHVSCRRRRTYSTALGVYQEQCGLRNVYMSWGAAEYLYMLLVLNQTQLPEEALFMIRYVVLLVVLQHQSHLNLCLLVGDNCGCCVVTWCASCM
jgi:hypothetical protein